MLVNIALINWYLLSRDKRSVDEGRVREIVDERTKILEICNKECVIGEIEKRITVSGSGEAEMLRQAQEEIKADDCDAACVLRIIRQEVPGMVEVLSKIAPTKAATGGTATALPLKTATVTIPTGSVRFSSSWQQVPASNWQLDSRLYGEIVSASWQGWADTGGPINLKVRLYDLTNFRVVDGSSVNVSGTGKVSFYSDNISLWRGLNNYAVEVIGNGEGDVTLSGMQVKFSYR